MRLLILGATGKTGIELVAQALEQGHEVTVLVRNPSKLTVTGKNLTVITGSVLDKNDLGKAMEGKEAVLSALGVGELLKPDNFIANAVRVIIPCMKDAGIKRIIFLSALGVGETYKRSGFIAKIIFRFILNHIYADKAIGDELLRNSGLDWTIVFPTKLTDSKRSGKYKVGTDLVANGFTTVSRADVVAFMLQQLTDTTFLRKEPIIL